jgi:hypothetical protein
MLHDVHDRLCALSTAVIEHHLNDNGNLHIWGMGMLAGRLTSASTVMITLQMTQI